MSDASETHPTEGVLRAGLGNPVAFLAYALPVGAVAVAGMLLAVLGPGSSGMVVTNGVLEALSVPESLLVETVVLLVAAFLADTVGSAAAAISIAARLRGGRPGLGAVWVRALRRLPAVLLLRLVVLLVAAIVAAPAVLVGLAVGAVAGILCGGVVLIAVLLLIPFVLAPVVAAVTGAGPLRSLAIVWRRVRIDGSGDRLNAWYPFLLVVAAAVLLAGIRLAGNLIPADAVAYGVYGAVGAVVGLVAAVLSISLLTLWSVRIAPEYDAAPPTRASRRIPVLPHATAGIAAALPATLLAVLLVTDAGGQTVATRIPLSSGFESASAASTGDGRVDMLTFPSLEPGLVVCEPHSCDSRWDVATPPGAVLGALPDGDMLIVGWQQDDTHSLLQATRVSLADLRHQDTTRSANITSRSLRLEDTAAGPHRLAQDLPRTDIGEFGFSYGLAVAPGTHQTVVASIAPILPVAADRHPSSTLTFYRCPTVDCSTPPTTVSAPLDWDPIVGSGYSGLDLATAPDGTAFASVTSGSATDPLVLEVLTPDGHLQRRVLEASLPEVPSLPETPQGARIAVDAQGRATVLFQAAGSHGFTLFRCDDATCAHWTRHDIDANGGMGSVPVTLALDATGRPMFAGFDDDSRRVVLDSCDDAVCSSWHTRPLGTSRGGGGLALVLDPSGHPLVVARDGRTSPWSVFRCAQLRCGAP